MLQKLFLGLSLTGAEWVLYLLILLSILSVTLMLERARFYRNATRGLKEFRAQIRESVQQGKWDEAHKTADLRRKNAPAIAADMESEMAAALLKLKLNSSKPASADLLTEAAQDSVIRVRLEWERNLAMLATIGSNAPFVGLFGTVLGIIKAFHDLSNQAGASVQGVSSGISEALIATAIGILVAIPAVVAFNFFQRKVKTSVAEAEALKSFLIGKIAE